jgi:hypothetical protein
VSLSRSVPSQMSDELHTPPLRVVFRSTSEDPAIPIHRVVCASRHLERALIGTKRCCQFNANLSLFSVI